MSTMPQNIRPVALFDATLGRPVDAFEFQLGGKTLTEPLSNILGRRFRQSMMAKAGVVISDIKDAFALLNSHLKRHQSVGTRSYDYTKFDVGHPDIMTINMEAKATHGYQIVLHENADLLKEEAVDLHPKSTIVVASAPRNGCEITWVDTGGKVVTIRTSDIALIATDEAITAIYEHYGIYGR